MQFWMEFFSIVAAIALVVQVAILIGLFLQLKRTTESINRMVNDLHTRVGPILTRTQILLDDTQPKITALVDDAAHVVYLARNQAQKMDKVFSEASERLRGQLVRVDRILTGTLEAVEDTGTQMRRTILGPVQKAAAIVQGIKVGLDFLRARRGQRNYETVDETPLEQEDELFI
jgi:type IV secretory pathway VirB2 component (pilin)